MAELDYTRYLYDNPDVMKAVNAGLTSAQDHWQNFGQNEGRTIYDTSGAPGMAVGNGPAFPTTTSTAAANSTGYNPGDVGAGGGTGTGTGGTVGDPGNVTDKPLPGDGGTGGTGTVGGPTGTPATIADGGGGVNSPRDITAAWTAEDVENFRTNSMWGSNVSFQNPYHYVDPWTGRNTILENIQNGKIPFNENYYLAQYPGVAEAVARGDYQSAAEHYSIHGYKEGKLVDPGQAEGYANMTQTFSQQTAGQDPVADALVAMGQQPNWTSSGTGGGYSQGGAGGFWDLVYGGGGGVYGQSGLAPNPWGDYYGQLAMSQQGQNSGTAYPAMSQSAPINYGTSSTTQQYGTGATSMYGTSAAYGGAPLNYGSSGGSSGTVSTSGHYGGGGMGLPSYAGANSAATPGMAQVVPGSTDGQNQINVAEWAGNIASRPANFLNTDDPRTPGINEGMFMANRNNMVNPFTPGTQMNPYNAAYSDLQNIIQTQNVQAAESDAQAALGYEAYSVIDLMNQHFTQAAQGVVSNQAQVNTSIGQALFTPGQAAQLNLNDIDARATVRGQLELLQADWTDPVTGESKIPLYAQAQAREVSKIAAFKGMTGTAATAAMSTALQEASISMAVKDAEFYQTVTLENLSNRQEMAVTNANILANMELQNADNRLAAAIENSRSFLEMDLANLSNQQQANVIDSQARIQSILDYAGEVNVARRFGAEAQNNMTQFYDNLNSQIRQYNAGLAQDRNQFDASMQNNREQFYAQLQYQVEQANAQWVQNVVLNEDQQLFTANQMDVQNMVQIGQEAIAQLWDRSDSLLDYAWQSTQNQLDRDATMAIEALKQGNAMELANQERDDAFWSSIGGAFFNSGGVDVVKDIGGAIFGGIF